MRLDHRLRHRADGRPRQAGRGLDEEEHDPIVDDLLQILGAPLVDRHPHVDEGDDLELPRGEAHQPSSALVEWDLLEPCFPERRGQRHAERRHAPLADSDEERYPSHDAVRIRDRDRVPDARGVLGEPGQRRRERAGLHQHSQSPRERGPGPMSRERRRRRVRDVAASALHFRVGQLQCDWEHDVLGHRRRLAQQRVARCAAAARRARPPDLDVDADDRGAGARDAGDQARENGPVPRTGAEPGLARRVASDDHQLGADRHGPAKPSVVDGPLEPGDSGIADGPDTHRHESGTESDHDGGDERLHRESWSPSPPVPRGGRARGWRPRAPGGGAGRLREGSPSGG